MDRIILLCAMLTVSFSVMAESQPWMKKDDPNSLGLDVNLGKDCPFDIKELRDMAEGEYLRARIKPTDDRNSLHITISALCDNITMDGKHIGTSSAYTIDFSTRVNFPDYITYVDYIPDVFILINTGTKNNEAKTYFLNDIKESLNIMITSYLIANIE